MRAWQVLVVCALVVAFWYVSFRIWGRQSRNATGLHGFPSMAAGNSSAPPPPPPAHPHEPPQTHGGASHPHRPMGPGTSEAPAPAPPKPDIDHVPSVPDTPTASNGGAKAPRPSDPTPNRIRRPEERRHLPPPAAGATRAPAPASPNATQRLALFREWLEVYDLGEYYDRLVAKGAASFAEVRAAGSAQDFVARMQWDLAPRALKTDARRFSLLFAVLPAVLPLTGAPPAFAPVPDTPLRAGGAPRHDMAAQALRTLPHVPAAAGVAIHLSRYDATAMLCGRWNLTAYAHLNVTLSFHDDAGLKVWPKGAGRICVCLEEPNFLMSRLPPVKGAEPFREYLQRMDRKWNGHAHHAFTIDPATALWFNSAPGPPSRTLVPYFMNEALIPPQLPKVFGGVFVQGRFGKGAPVTEGIGNAVHVVRSFGCRQILEP